MKKFCKKRRNYQRDGGEKKKELRSLKRNSGKDEELKETKGLLAKEGTKNLKKALAKRRTEICKQRLPKRDGIFKCDSWE
jgi:hypothetical protein